MDLGSRIHAGGVRETFDDLSLSVIHFLEHFPGVSSVHLDQQPGASEFDFLQWENDNRPYRLPSDLRAFLSISNGLQMRWKFSISAMAEIQQVDDDDDAMDGNSSSSDGDESNSDGSGASSNSDDDSDRSEDSKSGPEGTKESVLGTTGKKLTHRPFAKSQEGKKQSQKPCSGSSNKIMSKKGKGIAGSHADAIPLGCMCVNGLRDIVPVPMFAREVRVVPPVLAGGNSGTGLLSPVRTNGSVSPEMLQAMDQLLRPTADASSGSTSGLSSPPHGSGMVSSPALRSPSSSLSGPCPLAAFSLDKCCEVGRVVLCYNRDDSHPQIWLHDLGGSWSFIANNFSDYFRLLVVHLGLPRWQYAFADCGLDPFAKDWLRFFSPQRLHYAMARFRNNLPPGVGSVQHAPRGSKGTAPQAGQFTFNSLLESHRHLHSLYRHHYSFPDLFSDTGSGSLRKGGSSSTLKGKNTKKTKGSSKTSKTKKAKKSGAGGQAKKFGSSSGNRGVQLRRGDGSTSRSFSPVPTISDGDTSSQDRDALSSAGAANLTTGMVGSTTINSARGVRPASASRVLRRSSEVPSSSGAIGASQPPSLSVSAAMIQQQRSAAASSGAVNAPSSVGSGQIAARPPRPMSASNRQKN